MALSRNRFDGRLNGKTINDFRNSLDWDLQTLEERQKLVNSIINTRDNGNRCDEYFEKYYDQYFNVHPSCKENPSTGDNISTALETIANYLLFSPDVKSKKQMGIISTYKSKQQKAECMSLNVVLSDSDSGFSGMSDVYDSDGEVLEGNYIDELIRNGENYRKDTKQKIYKKDLLNPKLTAVKDYEDMNKVLHEYKKYLQDNDKIKYNKLKRRLETWMSLNKTCALDTKEAILKPIRWKQELKGTNEPGWLCFEECYEDNCIDIIKAELQLANRELIYDAGIIKYDLNCILEEISLNEIECKIINMISFKGLTQEQIGKSLGISQPAIICYLNKIAHKILDRYEEKLEEVVYTHGMKGKYKTCSRCKNVKLANERYFHKDATKKDGFKYACKDCEK